jgi:hypothetical protein
MPDKWDANVYRQRAEAWRKRAAQPSVNDDQKAACLALASDYEKLAKLIEQRGVLERHIPLLVKLRELDLSEHQTMIGQMLAALRGHSRRINFVSAIFVGIICVSNHSPGRLRWLDFATNSRFVI